MTRRRFILAAFCSALFGMLLAVLTNQGPFTPTAANPHPTRRERTWTQHTPSSTIPTFKTPSSLSRPTTSGNTATPTPTTPHQKDPTTTAPSTSTDPTASTGTSTPDPTTPTSTTSTDTTTTTEGAAVTTTQTTTPPPTDDSTAQSIATDVQGIGPPPEPQRALEGPL